MREPSRMGSLRRMGVTRKQGSETLFFCERAHLARLLDERLIDQSWKERAEAHEEFFWTAQIAVLSVALDPGDDTGGDIDIDCARSTVWA
jgi:hypothetical protein